MNIEKCFGYKFIVKRNDSRTVDKEHTNRKPNEKQYKTIIDAMKHFKMI